MAAWLLISRDLSENRIIDLIPETANQPEDQHRALVMSDVRRILRGA